jgi:hypothetical protein
MKTIAGLMLLALMAAGVFADNQVVERKYRHKPIENDHLGIVLLFINAKIDLKYVAGHNPDAQQSLLYGKLLQGFPEAFEKASTCRKTDICTTAVLDSISPHRFNLEHHDSMFLSIPLRVHFAGKLEVWPKHYVVIEITEASDDSSFKEVHAVWAPGNTPPMGSTSKSGVHSGQVHPQSTRAGGDGIVDIMVTNKEKPEECLHYACKYAFVDCSNNALVCWGTVSSEGCSTDSDRNAPGGVWSVSIRELVKQIVEDTPFEVKK